MALDAFLQALHNFASIELWLVIAAGVLVGLIFGIIPGISGLTAAALLLPFVFKMSAMQALPMIIGIMLAQYIGGSITSILINVPGDPANSATLLDGYPMSRKGEAGRALGAAFMASTAAKFLTVFLTLAMIPLILPIVMTFKIADVAFVMLLGISFIAVLGARSMVKGAISGGLGLLISFIGTHPATGIERFSFGSDYLYDGFPLLPVIMGMFAIPEMIQSAKEGNVKVGSQAVIKGMRDVWRGVTDVIHHWRVFIASNVIGYLIGVLPGIGGSSAAFMAYGQAKQLSKHPDEFGKGAVEGVIAPESSIVSEQAGAILTTLALGIPGNSIMVIMLAAITGLGLVPGPEMITRHLDLSLTLVMIFLAGGIVGAAICFALSPYLAKVASIPNQILIPLVLVITAVGLYAADERIMDVLAALFFGLLGLGMGRFGYNRPALVLGYILGDMFERNLFLALNIDGPLFFFKPISMILIAIIITVFAYAPVKGLLSKRRKMS